MPKYTYRQKNLYRGPKYLHVIILPFEISDLQFNNTFGYLSKSIHKDGGFINNYNPLYRSGVEI